jgi:N-acetylglucosaminyldiphosphoundecaprenol N-acetyl-beta-D-mannosaminyltransferase
MRKIKLFDYVADDGTLEQIDEKLLKLVEKRNSIGASLNASTIVLAEKDKALKKALSDADFLGIDGQSIVFASKVLNGVTPCRSPGIDVMGRLITRGIENNLSFYLLGADQVTLEKVVDIFTARGAQVAGARNGYWSKEEESSVVQGIAATNPDVVFLAFPSPAKEVFAHEHRAALNAGLIFCVGGSFDVLAGKVMRAPLFIQKLGLEWFFRWAQEPVRLFKRYFFGNIEFLVLIAKKKFKDEN